jgi:hypothetical protein
MKAKFFVHMIIIYKWIKYRISSPNQKTFLEKAPASLSWATRAAPRNPSIATHLHIFLSCHRRSRLPGQPARLARKAAARRFTHRGADRSWRTGRRWPPQAGGGRGLGCRIWAEATRCRHLSFLLPAHEWLAWMAQGSRRQIWHRGGGRLPWQADG